ncbi:MAG: prepilin-type N-terminal cleavage/methylation domain-containing protein [Candidatus Marinimicrobia bacterium]|nr:prepilin-type N-terminal cleavage/methylation domain-containing protein [Candidatus Neomarinimicrobiota bacterium]
MVKTKYTGLSQDGFSLIELMITILISSIVAIAVGTIVVTSQKYFTDGSKQVRLQRDYGLIVEFLAGDIRSGIADSSYIYTDSSTMDTGPAVNGGRCLKVGLSATEKQLFFQGGKDFVIITPSGTKVRLVTEVIDTLWFYYDNRPDSNRYVNFDLAMSKDDQKISTNHRFFYRN